MKSARCSFPLALAVLLPLAACEPAADLATVQAAPEAVTEAGADTDTSLTALPNSTFYQVTGLDLRKCAYPLCGGAFVTRPNQGTAVCSDGRTGPTCRILEFDYSALMLDRAGQDKLVSAAQKGQALLRGTITKTAPIAGRTYDKLVVKEAWLARALTTPTGTYSRVRELPIDCASCPTFSAEPLNSRAAASRYHSVEFDAARFSAALVTELRSAMSSKPQAVLIAGTGSVTTGMRQVLKASEAYTLLTPGPTRAKLGERCGTRGVPFDCEADLFCKREIDANCGRADASGTCTVIPMVCTADVKPVCGCDGRTYSNACVAAAGSMSVDYEGACN
jgi:hypothetical protein